MLGPAVGVGLAEAVFVAAQFRLEAIPIRETPPHDAPASPLRQRWNLSVGSGFAVVRVLLATGACRSPNPKLFARWR